MWRRFLFLLSLFTIHSFSSATDRLMSGDETGETPVVGLSSDAWAPEAPLSATAGRERAIPTSTLDIFGEVELTVTDVGALGYTAPGAGETGLGFRILGGQRALHHAGIVLGTSRSRVSDAAYGSDDNGATTPFDFVMTTPLRWEMGGTVARATYDDSGSNGTPLDVDVQQDVRVHPDQSFAIVDLCITANSDVSGLYAGLYTDWNVGTFLNNQVQLRTDTVHGRDFLSVHDASPVPIDPNHYGTVVLNGPNPNLRSIHNPTFVDRDSIAAGLPSKLYWASSGNILRANLDGSDPEQPFPPFNALDHAVDLLGNSLYWIDGDQILRVDLDDPVSPQVIRHSLVQGRDIELDVAGGKIYWVEQYQIMRANLDGSGVELVSFIPSFVGFSDNEARGIALDLEGGKIYWTETFEPGPRVRIRRSNLDGSLLEFVGEIIIGSSNRIALDSTAQNVYYTDGVDNVIRRVSTDGDELEILVSGLDTPVGITIDSNAGKMYWTESTSPQASASRANLDGSSIELLGEFGSVPWGIELVHRSPNVPNKMYWTEWVNEKIHRANLDGTNIEDLVTLPDPSQVKGLALDAPGGKMYWTDEDAGTISRANLDGTHVENVAPGDLDAPVGIALDERAGKMYWADRISNKIQRANLDGTDLEDLVAGLGNPRSIALDVGHGKMYWTDFETNKIQRSNLDGSEVEDLVDTGPGFAKRIALDIAGGHMYWGNIVSGEGASIRRSSLDGSDVVDLVTGLVNPDGTALDTAAGKMYWTDLALGNGKIQRADLDGSGVEDLVTTTANINPSSIRLLQVDPGFEDNDKYGFLHATGPTESPKMADWSTMASVGPFDLAAGETARVTFALVGVADEEDLPDVVSEAIDTWEEASFDITHAYWADLGTGKIQYAALENFDPVDLITGLDDPEGIAVDLAANHLYWVDRGAEKIQRSNLDGTEIEDLITAPGMFPRNIALDLLAGKMYWCESHGDRIQRANLDGSSVEEIVSGLGSPVGIALDLINGKAFWVDAETQKIQRSNLDGTQVEDLISTGLITPRGIVLDLGGGHMYWTEFDGDRIRRANLDGSNVEDLVDSGIDGPVGLVLDVPSNKMYWTERFTMEVKRADLDGSNVESVVTTGLSFPGGIALARGPLPASDVDDSSSPPLFDQLGQNSPNPFRDATTIGFSLSTASEVRLQIFDASGRLVHTLLDGDPLPAGHHSAVWHGENGSGRKSASGVYFYELEAGEFRSTRRVLLLR